MAGGNFVLGGLLSGLGRGMEQNYLANREDALQKLRAQQQIEAEDRGEQRAIRGEGRAEERDARKMARDAEYDVQKLKVAGDIKSKDRQDQFGYDVQLTKIKATEDRGTAAFKAKLDKDIETLKAQLDQKKDADSQRLRAELDGGNIKDRVTDANGRVILIRSDGQMITTPFTEKDKVDTSSYLGKDRKRGPTPEGFDPKARAASSNSPAPGPWYSPGASASTSEKVATAADIRDAVKQTGKSEAEVRRWMQANGWSLK